MNTTNSLAAILISFGLFFMVGKPAFSDVQKLRGETDELNTAITEMRDLDQKKTELLTKLNNIPIEDRDRISTFLPNKEGMLRLIADIDGIASRHGISIAGVNIGTASTDTSASLSEAVPEKAYNSKIIDVSFGASYTNLIAFLNDLEKSLRVIDVRSIDVSAGGENNAGVFQYKMSAEVYWLNDVQDEN
jgi:Tfp pilus assembly protein PilO